MMAFALSTALFVFWTLVGLGFVSALHARCSRLQQLLLAPLVGLVATLLPIFWLNRFGIPIREFAPALTVLLLLTSAALTWRWPLSIPWRHYSPFLVVLALALVLTGRPMFDFGFQWLSYANDDMANYSLNAERMVNYGFYEVPDADQVLRSKDITQFYWFFDLGNRPGAEMVLAWVSVLTGLNPHQVYMPYTLALHLVLISISGALVCQTRRFVLAAFLTCSLLAASALTSLGALYQLIGQVGGLALLTGTATLTLRPFSEVSRSHALRHGVLLGLVAAGLLVWYPEAVPFAILSIFLYVGLGVSRRELSFRSYGAVLGVASLAALVAVNTYAIPGALWLRKQAGGSILPSDVQAVLFPYYLIPSGLANFWGFQALSPLTGEPWLSVSIVLGGLLLLLSLAAVVWQCWNLHPSAVLALIMLLLGARLFEQRQAFGLFKLAMYIQPFLIGTIVVAWLAAVRQPVFRYAPIGVLFLAGLPAQHVYVTVSRAEHQGAGAGFVEIPFVSRGINDEFADLLKTNTAPNLVSDTANVVLAKFQALYSRGRSMVFPTQDFFFTIAEAVPELKLFLPNSASAADALLSARSARIAREQFDMQDSMEPSQNPIFEVDTFGQPPAVPIDQTAMVVTTPRQSLLNRWRYPVNEVANYEIHPWDQVRNHLIFVSSTRGRNYYSFEKELVSLFQLEPDFYFRSQTMAGLGRYILFQAVNPEPEVRLVLNLTSTLKSDGENSLPPAVAVGDHRQPFPVVGRGSARVFSPPIRPQFFRDLPYVAIDMGIEGRRISDERTGLMNLFGKDVPRDYRSLVAFGRDISLVSGDEYSRLAPPGFVQQFPADLADPHLQYSGIYEDGWVGEESYLDLMQPSEASTLTVRGTVPITSDPGFSTELRVMVGDKEATRQLLSAGEFNVNAIPPSGGGRHRVQLLFSRGQHLPAPDNRVAAGKLSFVGFDLMSPSAQKTSPHAIPEIALRSRGFALGRNWYPLETMGGENFRWVGNDAELLVAPNAATRREISLELEPGPGVGSRPFALDVFDGSGQKVATTEVQGRQKLTIPVPRDAASQQVLRLHVDGGGLPTPNDPRTLNFRVFRVNWASDAGRYDAQTLSKLNASADIGPADARQALVNGGVAVDGLYLGQGWYPYETFEGQSFRWVADDAEVVVTSPSGAKQEVRFEVEPGPGVGSQPFSLQVLDESNQLVASVPVHGRQLSRIVLPIKANTPTVFKLHVDGGGHPTPNDPRILNFRIFGFGWVDTQGSEGR